MRDDTLQQLLLPVVTALGYELIGVERLLQGRNGQVVRVYIDSPAGISLSDCERVSYQIEGLLDVEDPIRGHYALEISSPGINRPLFTLEQFTQFIGQPVKIRLSRPLNARRTFTGRLQQVKERIVTIVEAGTEYNLPYDQIHKAYLVPDF